MPENIAFTRAELVSLFDDLLYPAPDDPGPYGPLGPIISEAVQRVLAVMISPQPLPSLTRPSSVSSRSGSYAGPWPVPWRLAGFARAVIDRAVAQYQSAEVLGAGAQPEQSIEAIRSQIRDVIDDWCGTRPPRWPRPWPWPPKFDVDQLGPMELLAAGAQFQKAAAFDNPLQADFSAAADQLFEAGLKQLRAGRQ